MTRIKSFFVITAWLVAIMLLPLACSNDLDVKQAYTFDLETMPVPKKIAKGETVEIRCTLVREGNYAETAFKIRFFQEDGLGELKMDNGTTFLPNDLYPLEKSVFRLFYTSFSSEQSVFTVYIQDNFGQQIEKSFSFQDNTKSDE